MRLRTLQTFLAFEANSEMSEVSKEHIKISISIAMFFSLKLVQ